MRTLNLDDVDLIKKTNKLPTKRPKKKVDQKITLTRKKVVLKNKVKLPKRTQTKKETLPVIKKKKRIEKFENEMKDEIIDKNVVSNREIPFQDFQDTYEEDKKQAFDQELIDNFAQYKKSVMKYENFSNSMDNTLFDIFEKTVKQEDIKMTDPECLEKLVPYIKDQLLIISPVIQSLYLYLQKNEIIDSKKLNIQLFDTSLTIDYIRSNFNANNVNMIDQDIQVNNIRDLVINTFDASAKSSDFTVFFNFLLFKSHMDFFIMQTLFALNELKFRNTISYKILFLSPVKIKENLNEYLKSIPRRDIINIMKLLYKVELNDEDLINIRNSFNGLNILPKKDESIESEDRKQELIEGVKKSSIKEILAVRKYNEYPINQKRLKKLKDQLKEGEYVFISRHKTRDMGPTQVIGIDSSLGTITHINPDNIAGISTVAIRDVKEVGFDKKGKYETDMNSILSRMVKNKRTSHIINDEGIKEDIEVVGRNVDRLKSHILEEEKIAEENNDSDPEGSGLEISILNAVKEHLNITSIKEIGFCSENNAWMYVINV